MSDCGCNVEIKDKSQARVLIILLSINATMFVFEFGIGWFAQSTALIADALDMLADAMVYGVGLYAVGKTLRLKAKAAMMSGILQLALGLMVLVDIIRRLIFGSEPESMLMMALGVVALIANVICLRLIMAHREGEVHMRASWIFSKNDVIANLGIIIAGILVWQFDNRWPDIIIGSIVVMFILNGAKHIIMDAKQEMKNASCASAKQEL